MDSGIVKSVKSSEGVKAEGNGDVFATSPPFKVPAKMPSPTCPTLRLLSILMPCCSRCPKTFHVLADLDRDALNHGAQVPSKPLMPAKVP